MGTGMRRIRDKPDLSIHRRYSGYAERYICLINCATSG